MKSKYTFAYNPQIEILLDSFIATLTKKISESSVANYIEFVVLGGGYGRGEGGILQTENSSKLYNDLDFFVLAYNDVSDSQLSEVDFFFSTLSKELEKLVEIDVDFSKAVKVVYAAEHLDIMAWKEMALGANVIFGDKQKFGEIFISKANNKSIVASEMMKLAMNRISGLVFAFENLQTSQTLTNTDNDFIARNINKAILATGDIYLASNNTLPLLVAERLSLIEKLGKTQIAQNYKLAVEFKAFPKIDFTKQQFESKLQNAVCLLKKSCVENNSYLSERNLKRFLKDILLNLKINKEFSKIGLKFPIFISPRKSLIDVACSLLEGNASIDFSTYKKIWERLA